MVRLLLHSAVCAAQDRKDEAVVSVEDADVEAATIVDLDASDVVQSILLVGDQADASETTVSNRLENGERELRSSANLVSVKRMATTVLRSCHEDLSRAVPRTTIW